MYYLDHNEWQDKQFEYFPLLFKHFNEYDIIVNKACWYGVIQSINELLHEVTISKSESIYVNQIKCMSRELYYYFYTQNEIKGILDEFLFLHNLGEFNLISIGEKNGVHNYLICVNEGKLGGSYGTEV